MAYLDYKVTSWKRVFVPDEKVDEVIAKLKKGDCDVPYDLPFEIEGCYDATSYGDESCEEPMLPEENNGSATQELYGSDHNIIYKNDLSY